MSRHRAAYRLLLGLLPAPLRTRFGADMEELFTHRITGAQTWNARAWIWVRAVVDVLEQAVLERIRPERTHETEGDGMWTGIEDLRWAVRGLRRSPLFATVAVLTLALGIGASTATFSVVGTALFEEMPYADPERLVALWPEAHFNNAMVREAVASMPAIESASGLSGWDLILTGEGEPLEVDGNRVWANHFRVLGVEPMLGRTFTDEEQLPGRDDVVVLSHGFWVRVFGADSAVIGRRIRLSGADHESRTVIGVMPAGFVPIVGQPDMWVPMSHDPATPVESDDSWYVNHRIARLTPGATLAQADEQMKAFARDMRERRPRTYDEESVRNASVGPWTEYVAGDLKPVLQVALAAVSLVLLIACANVANLLLARGEARGRDLAVRAALGADRRRVVRMLLLESGVLGIVGGALGILLSFGLVRLIVSAAPADFPRIREVGVDGPVLLYAVAVTGASILLAGLMPAFRVSRVEATSSLGGSTRAASARRTSRVTLGLVGLEVALAVVVTVGSGLMIRSLHRLTSMDTGFDPEGVVVLRASPPEGRYAEADAFRNYYVHVLERVRARPEVVSAGAIHLLPGTANNWNFPTWPEGLEVSEGTPPPMVNFRVVRPGYFETVGLDLVRGRQLIDSDDGAGERVMVVNQEFVDRFWPGLDPQGRMVRTLSSTGDPYRVVGVVGNVRQHGFARPPEPEMYLTSDQWSWNVGLWVVARTREADPMASAAALQEAIWSVDRDVPISGVAELSSVFDESAATTRFITLVLGAFGALALALGAVGVFGVTAFAVGRRIPEFGVRLALGSSRSRVLGSALLTCAVPVGTGLLVGIVGAVFASAALRSALFGVEPSDPLTLVMVALTLVVMATLASLLPAWRASRVDPVTVLNAE